MLLTKKPTLLYAIILIASLENAHAHQENIQEKFDAIYQTTKQLEPEEQKHIRKILCQTGDLIDDLVEQALEAYECACCIESNPTCIRQEYANINNVANGIHIASKAFKHIAIYLTSTMDRCASCNMSPEGWLVCKKIIALLLADCISAFDKKRQVGSDFIIIKLSQTRQRIDQMAMQLG